MSKVIPRKAAADQADQAQESQEIEQVRELLFGMQQRQTETKMSEVLDEIRRIEKSLSERLQQVEADLKSTETRLSNSQSGNVQAIGEAIAGLGLAVKGMTVSR